MKPVTQNVIAWTIIALAVTCKLPAQVNVMANYIFTQDSVSGFDEKKASEAAYANACYGLEYKVFLYKAKREYIKQKYDLPTLTPAQVTLFQNPVSRPSSPPGAVCDNEDFEMATSNIVAPNSVQGWTLQSGTNGNSCNAPNLTGVNLYTVFTSPITDNRLPNQVKSYFDAGSSTSPSGNAFIRLNDASAGAKAVRLSKAFIPNANSALFQYAYLPVIEDGSHQCCDQAGFNIKITVTNTTTSASTVLACPNISVSVPGAACNFQIPPGGPAFMPCPNFPGWTYANWTASALDLTPYIGFLVKIDVTVVDCAQGGHAGYFYFDAKCSPMTIIGNGNSFPAGTPSITLPTCGASGATICAPSGLGPYSWAGPNVPQPYTIPSMTNQCFTATISATYTLYMSPPGSCAPIIRLITSSITPAPLLLASVQQAMCGGTTAVITLTPAGSASTPSQLMWSPLPQSMSSSSTTATYTVPPGPNPNVITATALDPLGCMITQTLNVNPSPPIPSFTVLNQTGTYTLTCTNPTIGLDAASNYTYGTLNYFWQSPSYTNAASTAVITNSGTIVITINDPATGCASSKTVNVYEDKTLPNVVVTPTLQNITCGMTTPVTMTSIASPTVNIMQTIFYQQGATFSTVSPTMVVTILPTGTHVVVVENVINGCKTSKTFTITSSSGFPTYSVSSAQNFTLGCGSKSLACLNIDGANTNPHGGVVNYGFYPPGYSGSFTVGAVSNTCVNIPGTWTLNVKDMNNNCETRVPVSVLLKNFPPDISAIVERQVLDCAHPTVTLQGVSQTNNISYEWGLPVGTQLGYSLVVSANTLQATNTLVANYSLTVMDNVNACKSFSTITIFQNLFRPLVVISNGSTSAISCLTPSVTLTNVSASQIPPMYPPGIPLTDRWDGPTPQEPKFQTTTYEGRVPGIYTLTVKDSGNGCTATGTVNIGDDRDFPEVNKPTVPGPYILDCGNKPTAKVWPTISSPTANLTYTWVPPPNATVTGVNSRTLTTENLGEYKIIVQDSKNGCISTGFMEVVPGTLTAEFKPEVEQGFAPLEVNFENLSRSSLDNNNITTTWNFGNGSTNTYSSVAAAKAIFTQGGTYTVTIYVSKGKCIEIAQKVIIVDMPSELVMPNVFTPNNDNVNDIFFIKSTNLVTIDIVIFDRWGHLVYKVSSETGNIAWDGKNQYGKEVAEGTYFYTINASGYDGLKYDKKGTVSLFR